MSSNRGTYNPQLQRPRSSFDMPNLHKCVDCDNLIPELDRRCLEHHMKFQQSKRQEEEFVNKSYCPRCGMILAEHKEIELKLCLYNLRGLQSFGTGMRK